MIPTLSLKTLLTAYAEGQFRTMTREDYFGFAGASETTKIWVAEDGDHIALFDPENPADGFELYNFNEERFGKTPNQSACWQVRLNDNWTELYS